MPWELPIHAARGTIDFLSTERRGDGPALDSGTFRLWKALQNSGFRIALTGASDFHCIHWAVDETAPRTDVLLEGDVSYDSWLDAIRSGRASLAVGHGSHLDLRVDKSRLGEEVTLPAGGGSVSLQVESRFPASDSVDLLVNGRVVQTVFMDGGAQVATVNLPLASSAWIFARSRSVATSPVYVVVGGAPVRGSAADVCYLVGYVDHLSRLVSSHRLDLGASTGQALAAYAGARRELMQRFLEAGGQTCP
jgi:hypothetical protein